ncbi:putative membrane protein [Ruaniaceae bacterium KH17]|nr:putative membrane protein [Ruaniaceae bacterium KH17]
MALIIRVAVNSLAIWLTTLILPGLEIVHQTDEGWKQVGVVLVVGLIFTILNAIVKPIIQLFSIPFLLLTFGLFAFVINAIMLLLTDWVSGLIGWGLSVENFGWALLGAIVISLIAMVLNSLAPIPKTPR